MKSGQHMFYVPDVVNHIKNKYQILSKVPLAALIQSLLKLAERRVYDPYFMLERCDLVDALIYVVNVECIDDMVLNDYIWCVNLTLSFFMDLYINNIIPPNRSYVADANSDTFIIEII